MCHCCQDELCNEEFWCWWVSYVITTWFFYWFCRSWVSRSFYMSDFWCWWVSRMTWYSHSSIAFAVYESPVPKCKIYNVDGSPKLYKVQDLGHILPFMSLKCKNSINYESPKQYNILISCCSTIYVSPDAGFLIVMSLQMNIIFQISERIIHFWVFRSLQMLSRCAFIVLDSLFFSSSFLLPSCPEHDQSITKLKTSENKKISPSPPLTP